MLKLIGSLLVIGSTSLIGIYYSRVFFERLQQIRDFQYAFTMLESEIVYSSMPLSEALECVSLKSKSPIKEFFYAFSNKLLKKETEGIVEGFKETLSEFQKEIKLSKEEIDTVISFLKSLESSDMEGQKINFNITMKKFEGFEKKAEVEVVKNEKLYKYLGVCSGILIVIILI